MFTEPSQKSCLESFYLLTLSFSQLEAMLAVRNKLTGQYKILSLPNLAATSNNITRRYTSMFLDADLHNCGNMPNNRLSKHS